MIYPVLGKIKGIFAVLMNYMVILTGWITVCAGLEIKLNVPLLCASVAVPVIYYAFRRYVKSFILFVLLHVSLPVLFFFVSDFIGLSLADRIMGVVVYAVMALASFVWRIRDGKKTDLPITPEMAAIAFVVAIIAMNYMKRGSTTLIGAFALFYTTIYILNLFIVSFLKQDDLNRRLISNVPSTSILRSSLPAVGIMAGIFLAAGALLLEGTLIRRFLDFLKGAVKAFFRWFFSLFPQDGAAEEIVQETMENNMPSMMDMLPLEAKEPSPIMVFLEKVFMFAVSAAIVGGVIFGIAYLIIKLVAAFRTGKGEKTVEVGDGFEEVREKISRRKFVKKPGREDFVSSNSKRIRRMYIKLVQKNPGITDRISYVTAREFAASFPEEKKDSAEKFALIYEKARYSGKDCTSAEVSEAKRMLGVLC